MSSAIDDGHVLPALAPSAPRATANAASDRAFTNISSHRRGRFTYVIRQPVTVVPPSEDAASVGRSAIDNGSVDLTTVRSDEVADSHPRHGKKQPNCGVSDNGESYIDDTFMDLGKVMAREALMAKVNQIKKTGRHTAMGANWELHDRGSARGSAIDTGISYRHHSLEDNPSKSIPCASRAHKETGNNVTLSSKKSPKDSLLGQAVHRSTRESLKVIENNTGSEPIQFHVGSKKGCLFKLPEVHAPNVSIKAGMGFVTVSRDPGSTRSPRKTATFVLQHAAQPSGRVSLRRDGAPRVHTSIHQPPTVETVSDHEN